MSDLFIVGGAARRGVASDQQWRSYDKAILLRMDSDTLSVEKAVEYISPSDACADESPAIIFKSGTLQDNLLYLCTETELLLYDITDFSIQNYISLPYFNDLHHVAPTRDGTYLAAVTGLDMVVEVTHDGETINEWDVLGNNTWDRFSRTTDYRKIPSTKPHLAHPNFVFTIGDDIWTTRCNKKDAQCLTDFGKKIDLSGKGIRDVSLPHDGIFHNGNIYFTSVDGNILVADEKSLKVHDIINIGEFLDAANPLGWCRGIRFLDEHRLIVGFSRLRATKLEYAVRRVKAQVKTMTGLKGHRKSPPLMPSRICCLNLKTNKQEWQINLEKYGMNAVFSIL